MVGVLHLGLGQGGDAGGAPVDRLLAPVEPAVLGKAGQFRGGDPLVDVVHGQVGLVPFAEDAEPLELLTLDTDELGGILAAELPHLQLGDLVLLRAQILLHLQFDGETVAVPAGDVGGLEAAHPLALEDDVLQDLVEGMADMDMAVGIGGAVMEDVFRLFPAGVHHLAIEVIPAHRSRISGSLWERLAFMGKSVTGRLRVSLYSM